MKTAPGAGGEIQLTDAIQQLLQEEPVYACQFKGCRYDAGNKLEYLKATVEFALQREDLQEDFQNYLKQLKQLLDDSKKCFSKNLCMRTCMKKHVCMRACTRSR